MAELKKIYQLQKEDDGIYLLVKNDPHLALPIKIENLYYELAQRKISYDVDFIKECFAEASGEKEKIASLQSEQIYSPLLDLNSSSDKMKAVLKVYPSLNNTLLELATLEQFLQEKGIREGLKTELFPEIVKAHSFYQEWLIAEGKPSVNGKNANLKFHFQKEGIALKPKELGNGSVDFYDLSLIQIAMVGMTLVERIPPTEGTKGMNVLGEEIKAKPGKDVRLPLGVNTEIIDDNTKLVSTIEGQVNFINNKVNVYPTYELKGDVDFNTGNIEFPGNVIVKGNVKNTFSIEAGGDVEIYGNLAGTVISGGNLNVKKGIIQGKAEVEGSIYVRYIENGSAFSKENVIVSEAIMHSIVKAEKKLSVSGKKGLIVGGDISAGEEISAKNIGSPMGTNTILQVGLTPVLIDEYKELCNHLKHYRENQEKSLKILNTLQKMQTTGGFSAEKKVVYNKVQNTYQQGETEIEKLENRKNELELQLEEVGNACIKVLDTIYSGVVINIGKISLPLYEEKSRLVFRLEDYEIRGFTL
ncbi:MAG: FapA family protein [Clostridia bacterium]|nr:FapA family protein [Clostridia bacterium]MDD4145549.1 FapA family protein [Clostridia bacterium]MDD4664975.1 FapA family protein [Clostridia bacterium]